MSNRRNLNKKLKRDHRILLGIGLEMYNKGKSEQLEQEAKVIMDRVQARELLYPGTWKYNKKASEVEVDGANIPATGLLKRPEHLKRPFGKVKQNEQ